MEIQLTIGGMCMMVPYVRTNGTKRLQLLFPHTGHHEHQARLVYLAKYEDVNALAGEKREVPLEGRQLEIAPAASGPDFTLPPEVVDLGAHPGIQRPVPQKFLAGTEMHIGLRSRVQLGAGSAVDVRQGAKWLLAADPNARFLATAVEWLISGVPGSSLTLEIRNRKGDVVEETRTLTPHDGTGRLHLFLLHVPEAEVPDVVPVRLPMPTATQPDRADHFEAYYSLLDPNTPAGVPRKPPQVTLTPGPTLSFDANVGSEYTCVVCTAPPQ